MDESRFRSLMQRAIGEETMQPYVAAAVRDRLQVRQPHPSKLPWLIAVATVLLVVVAVVVPQLSTHRSASSRPTVIQSLSPAPSVDPSGCQLPVLLVNGQAGFIDTTEAGFTPDASAGKGAMSFSPTARAWLPVPPRQISPDGRRYAWLRGRDVDTHDIAGGTDVAVWTAPVDVYIWRWDSSGIFVSDQPPPMLHLGARTWLLNPASGGAVEDVIGAGSFPFLPLPGDPHGTDGTSFHPIGFDTEGRNIWWFFNLDKPGAVDWVFYETAPGQRVYIYKGTQGDATGFDPDSAFADATGVWFVDRIHNAIWHWQIGGELVKVQPPSRAAMLTVATIAGPCF